MAGWKRYTYYKSLLELFNKWYGRPAFVLTKIAYKLSVSLRFFSLHIISRFYQALTIFLSRTKLTMYIRAYQHSINNALVEYDHTREYIKKFQFEQYAMPDEIKGYLESINARPSTIYIEDHIY